MVWAVDVEGQEVLEGRGEEERQVAHTEADGGDTERGVRWPQKKGSLGSSL